MTSESTAPETLFDLALYLVCSARLALDENLGLASFRLTEAASRLIASSSHQRPSRQIDSRDRPSTTKPHLR